MLPFEGVAYSCQIHVLDIPGCEDYLSMDLPGAAQLEAWQQHPGRKCECGVRQSIELHQ